MPNPVVDVQAHVLLQLRAADVRLPVMTRADVADAGSVACCAAAFAACSAAATCSVAADAAITDVVADVPNLRVDVHPHAVVVPVTVVAADASHRVVARIPDVPLVAVTDAETVVLLNHRVDAETAVLLNHRVAAETVVPLNHRVDAETVVL